MGHTVFMKRLVNKTRLSDHQRCLKTRVSIVAPHQHKTGHQLFFDNAPILVRPPDYVNRQICESIQTTK